MCTLYVYFMLYGESVVRDSRATLPLSYFIIYLTAGGTHSGAPRPRRFFESVLFVMRP